MKASYEISKIKAMVLYILKESGGTLDFITLFKNMYFSQREFLVKFGRPLFKDSFRAVKLGPVPSFTYAAFSYALNDFVDATEDIKQFDSSFQVEEKDKVRYVTAVEEPDMDELAVAEVRIINQILEENKGKSAQELSILSHEDKAWQAANRRAKDDPRDNYMSLVNIARAGGANEKILEHIRQSQAFEAFCKE